MKQVNGYINKRITKFKFGHGDYEDDGLKIGFQVYQQISVEIRDKVIIRWYNTMKLWS